MKIDLVEIPRNFHIRRLSEGHELDVTVKELELPIKIRYYLGKAGDDYGVFFQEESPERTTCMHLSYQNHKNKFYEIKKLFEKGDFVFEFGPLQRISSLEFHVNESRT